MQRFISPNYKCLNGKEAWQQNLHAVIYAADKIRSILGPKGAYKLVTYNRGPEQVIKVTKDPIAILDELAIQYPPAIIVAEAAKMQRDEAGDGTATFVIFLSALLKKADELLAMKICANTILHGYYLATEKALEVLENKAVACDSTHFDVLDTIDCGKKLLTPPLHAMIKEAYALASREGRFNRDLIRFNKKSGSSIAGSTLTKGITIKKEKAHPNMPDCVEGARIAITTQRLGINRLEVKMRGEGPFHITLNVKSACQIAEYKQTEKKLKTQCINKLADLGINVLLCQQPLDENQKALLNQNNILGFESVEPSDAQAVAKATGAKIVGPLKDLDTHDIGKAERVVVEKNELIKTAAFQGCNSATFVLRGSVPQAIDELETAILNSLTTLKILNRDSRILPGGGATEAFLARELKDYAKGFASWEQIVIQSFSDALLDVPICLAENYGLNATDTLIELKNRHAEDNCAIGICQDGCRETVCVEPLSVKRSVLRRSYEVSALLLRIDQLIISKEIPKFHKT